MRLEPDGEAVLRELRDADGSTFAELVRIAGLDPARDLRGTDLTGVDFAGCDLTDYDFSDATLTGASFVGAHVVHARFDRADIDGVVWPSGWRSGRDGRGSQVPQSLLLRQQEIADALLEALLKPSPARAIAILPPGVGKSRILAEVFRQLSRKKRFRRGLVLCETVVERDQLIEVLRERGVETADVRLARNRGVIEPSTTLVETFGNHGRMLNEVARTTEEWSDPLKSTHIALTSLPTRRRSLIARMAKSPASPAMLAFVEAAMVGTGDRDRLERSQLARIFEAITYDYEVDRAVADGVLVPAEVIDRSYAVLSFGRGDASAPRWPGVLEEVASDFEMELDRAAEPMAALLLVPEDEDIERLAEILRTQMLRASEGRGDPFRVTVITGRARRDDWLPPPRSAGVVLATPELSETLNLRDFGLIGVLTSLSDGLATRLCFPPARREGQRLRVLDYAGELATRQAVAKGAPG